MRYATRATGCSGCNGATASATATARADCYVVHCGWHNVHNCAHKIRSTATTSTTATATAATAYAGIAVASASASTTTATGGTAINYNFDNTSWRGPRSRTGKHGAVITLPAAANRHKRITRNPAPGYG